MRLLLRLMRTTNIYLSTTIIYSFPRAPGREAAVLPPPLPPPLRGLRLVALGRVTLRRGLVALRFGLIAVAVAFR